jgi:hypothetical protein
LTERQILHGLTHMWKQTEGLKVEERLLRLLGSEKGSMGKESRG